MAFTARTETYARGSSLTTPFNFTINKATGTVDGDIMFMFLAIYLVSPPTIDSVPSDWTLIATNTTTNSRWYLYYKIASGEGASYTWSLTASCRYYALNIAYSSGDFDVQSIDDITAISNTLYPTAAAAVRAASMSVSDANSPLVYFGAIYNTTVRTFTKPILPTTDWIEDADEGHTTPDLSLTIGSMIWTGSGATGNMDITCSTSITTYKHAFAIALKPITLTTIGDTAQEVWNVRQTVPDTSQSIWNVRYALGDTSQVVWNVKGIISDTIQSIWNILTPIGDTTQFVWNLRYALGNTIQQVWNTRFALGDTIQTVWNIGTAIGDTIGYVWNVLTSFGDTTQSVWNIKELATKTSQSVWNIRNALGDSLQAIWDVRYSITNEIQQVWNIATSLGKASQSIWNVLTLVSKNTQIIWNIRNYIGESIQLVYNLYAKIGKTSQYIWNVLFSTGVIYYGVLKRWTGTIWTKALLKTYLGYWQSKPLKRWDGSEWKEIDTTGV